MSKKRDALRICGSDSRGNIEGERGGREEEKEERGGRGEKLVCGWNGETIVKWILSDKGEEELPERGRGMDGWRDGWLDRLPTLQ